MEIGSEFEWDYNNSKTTGTNNFDQNKEWIYTFSGRTAIETVLRNITSKKKALLPEYCCDSILVPFRHLGVDYNFYSVKLNDEGIFIKINEESLFASDILYLVNYFGFKIDFPEDLINRFRQAGGIVIEDITHSLFSNRPYHYCSDWVLASLRKWGALLDGGFCWCIKETPEIKPSLMPSDNFIEKKRKAMLLKEKYIKTGVGEKQDFLSLYAETNHELSEYYSNTAISVESLKIFRRWNIDKIRKQRVKNAVCLYSELKDLVGIKPLFKENKIQCPLFVPIIVKSEKRDLIRKKLIENNIYCPIHWPIPKDRPKSRLYDVEISLICDQRYNEGDMKRIGKILKACEV